MTELERKALLGDREAQQKCTEKGIVLPCPFCGSKVTRKIGLMRLNFFKCSKCGAVVSFDNDYYNTHKNEAILAWNTRQAPPIGRCGECKFFNTNYFSNGNGLCERINSIRFEYGYCQCFEPRCEE